MVEVKVFMALTDDESGVVGKESARNGEWVKISIRKHENTDILKENQTLRKEMKELTDITETWLNSSNKVKQLINEQVPNQKRKILRANQLTKDSSSSRKKDLVSVKSSSDNNNVSKLNVERPWFSKAEGLILPNHGTGRILPPESQCMEMASPEVSDDVKVTRRRLHLFQFSLRDHASNWLERLPAGSISTWEDLTTCFLPQFFLPVRTTKLRNDILMFKQHQGEFFSEAWTRSKDLLQKFPHYGIDLYLKIQIFYDHVSYPLKHEIDHAAGGKLRDKSVKESWEIIEDLALYDNESWNDPRDLAKPVKAISFPQDVPSTSDRRLVELENQVQRLMEAQIAPKPSVQVNKSSPML
ncbi:zinc finger, CCHC-type containing protein [Tanacetum coccineum]